MADVKIVLNSDGVREMLKSAEMQAACEDAANGVVGRAPGEYVTQTKVGTNRCSVTISTSDSRTYRSNLKHNHLIKALGG